MIISVNWLKKFVAIDRPIDELATLIGSRLVEIEEIVDLGVKYRDVIVAQVKKVEQHPNADRLHIVQIDDNRVREDVERLENGYVQVVCGAPNVSEGMFVAWLPPGATVPATAADAEPFVLDARELRGVKSNGMLASAKELAIGEGHDGIVDIDKQTTPGASFAELYELDDYLLDIENKSLTHRPDVFGLIGFAREIAAIQGLQFTTPEWLKVVEPLLSPEEHEEAIVTPSVTIQDDVSARYQAVVLSDVDASRQSPIQIQSYLQRVGMRPISIAVDTTNYLMLLTGQPLHAFDYDKFIAASSTGKADIVVRKSKQGETLTLLDGRTITLSDADIIIAAGETPVGLAGAMGGASTEISGETKRIILEVATFDLYALRTTQMRHGIFSEAITRFTKGQPARLTAPILASAVRMLTDLAGARRVTEIVDIYPQPDQPSVLTLPLAKINAVLGTELTVETAATPLRHVEFTVEIENEQLTVTAPYWRADIHIAEDVIEEIGRIEGFDSIVPTLPQRTFKAVMPETFDTFRDGLRDRLQQAGANEVLTYSFVHGKLLESAGQDPAKAFRITNALSPDLQYYRLSLTPSILSKVRMNSKQGFASFALFEINKTHQKDVYDTRESQVPAESHRLALTVAATDKAATHKDSAYYTAKAMLEYLLKNQKLSFVPFEKATTATEQPFQPQRSAKVLLNGTIIGIVGEYTAQTQKNFKLTRFSAGFEIDLEALFAVYDKRSTYTPLSRFQGTDQDICVQVSPETSFAQIVEVMEGSLQDNSLEWSLHPLDIYQPEDASYKNVTIRLAVIDHEKTVATSDVKVMIEKISSALKSSLGAKIV